MFCMKSFNDAVKNNYRVPADMHSIKFCKQKLAFAPEISMNILIYFLWMPFIGANSVSNLLESLRPAVIYSD